MRNSVPSARYSSVCNVLHLLSISLIPTYRVYTDSMIIIKFLDSQRILLQQNSCYFPLKFVYLDAISKIE